MSNSKESKEETNVIKIQFGTKFIPKEKFRITNPDRIEIVTEVGQEIWFESQTLMKDKDGEEILVGGGTGGLDVIEKVVGIMQYDDVIAAMNRYFRRRYNQDLPEDLIEFYLEEASKEPRVLVK